MWTEWLVDVQRHVLGVGLQTVRHITGKRVHLAEVPPRKRNGLYDRLEHGFRMGKYAGESYFGTDEARAAFGEISYWGAAASRERSKRKAAGHAAAD